MLTPFVEGCAKKIEDLNKESYPLYQDFSEVVSLKAQQRAVDKAAATNLKAYYPVTYAIDITATPKMSGCGGKAVLNAGPMTLAECAKACDVTRYPQACTGFQFIKIGGEKMP